MILMLANPLLWPKKSRFSRPNPFNASRNGYMPASRSPHTYWYCGGENLRSSDAEIRQPDCVPI